MAALAVLAALLSGCAAEGGKGANGADTGSIDQAIVDGGPAGTPESAGSGAILGSVIDDSGIHVADALVSLLGTERSARTNATGAFRLDGVAPGTHGLRVVAGSLYRVHEGDVTVAAGKTTVLTVTLVTAESRGPGYRPHLHDHWGTASEVALIDHEYDLRKSRQFSQYGAAGDVVTGVVEPNNGNWWWPLPIPQERDDGRPAIVLPGTKEVRVTLSWGSDVDMDQFVVGYFTAASAAEKRLDPQTNGLARTIPLSDGEADNGHQSFSLWGFNLRPSGNPPGTTLGSIHVQVVLVKGEAVPAEPAHEDFWNGTSALVVRSGENATAVGVIAVTGCGESGNQLALDAGRIVPPGTQRLELRFRWASQRHAADDGVFTLLWKPADLPPGAAPGDYQTAAPVSSEGTSRHYQVEVDPAQTDAFYQKKSNWLFYAKRTDVRAEAGGACATNTEQAHVYWLEVIAHKDPSFQ